MGTILIWLILLLTGAMLLFTWALRIQNRNKRKAYMMGTHLALVVPGSVGVANNFFPPETWFSFVMALIFSVGIVLLIWTAISLIVGLKQKSKQ